MDKKLCFIMMPFGDNFDEYYSEIYSPAVIESKLVPKRADSIYKPSPILHDIWSFINDSLFVIADISGKNPNAMYELGLAHSIAKPAIIISNDINDVPFDLRALRILLYNTQKPNWALKLKESIKASISEILDSPIETILPTFINTAKSKKEEVSEIKKDLIEIKQFLYRLDVENVDEKEESKNKILTPSEYSQAVNDVKALYYRDGETLSEIQKHIMERYKVGIYTAMDIVERGRR